MQRCLDCSSSPIADLASRHAAQGWASKYLISTELELLVTLNAAVFTLNEPDINGITPSQAASWYIEYINPLVSIKFLVVFPNNLKLSSRPLKKHSLQSPTPRLLAKA